MIKEILIGAAIREGLVQTMEIKERRQIFNQARDYADQVGKPLLVVGSPKFQFNHPCGDVTIDISPEMAKFCDAEIADVRDIPYPDSYFGAAFCSHVLEHLPTIEDAGIALDELERVADRVFVVSPHKTSIMAWINPGHHLWVTPSGDGYILEQRGNGLAKEESYIIAIQVE
jgi:hypothetical protein